MGTNPETKLTNQIRAAIKKRWPDIWTVKIAGGGYQQVGLPDLFIVLHGRFIGLEVKCPKPGESDEHARGRATALQMRTLWDIEAAGGLGAVVVSVEEALRVVAKAEPELEKSDGSWQPSAQVVKKAREYLRECRVSPDEVPGVWWVRGSAGKYRVQTDAHPDHLYAHYLTCTCAHGAHAGGRAKCSHVVAVALTLTGYPAGG